MNLAVLYVVYMHPVYYAEVCVRRGMFLLY